AAAVSAKSDPGSTGSSGCAIICSPVVLHNQYYDRTSVCQDFSEEDMGHSQADKAASRERILEAAAHQISERGLDSVSVGELMQNAGLTKGAFYGHSESREAMIAEAARRAMQNGQAKLEPLFTGKKRPTLKQVVDLWLDTVHVENRLDGCGIC